MTETIEVKNPPEFENACPLDIQLWADTPEMDAAVDAIFAECKAVAGITRIHERMKGCLNVVLVNLFSCYLSEPTQYVRYSRSHRTWLKQYNCLDLSTTQICNAVDRLEKRGYLTHKLGEWAPDEKDRRQSRMRATEKLIECLSGFGVLQIMIMPHPRAGTIILKDEDKKLKEFEQTDETRSMAAEMQIINYTLSETLISLYMSDKAFRLLQKRMKNGKVKEADENIYDGYDEDEYEGGNESIEEEIPRGAINFTKKHLKRVFNNNSFRMGGRLYGGWWQAVPKKYRSYIKINQAATVEPDFSAIHINLIYWLEKLPVPEGDLYALDGFSEPKMTREVVKKCLLTMLNAENRRKAMKSIRERIAGVKWRKQLVNGKPEWVEKEIQKKNMIILPPDTKIEKIIKAFEKKHKAIAEQWFFKGKGLELQYWDSKIAMEILLILAEAGVPALPVHDSFIVSWPQEAGLRKAMSDAFYKITGRYPNVDTKDNFEDINRKRGKEALDRHYRMKKSKAFPEKWSTYYNSIKDWQKFKGRSSIVFFTNKMNISDYKKEKGEDEEETYFVKDERLQREIPKIL